MVGDSDCSGLSARRNRLGGKDIGSVAYRGEDRILSGIRSKVPGKDCSADAFALPSSDARY